MACESIPNLFECLFHLTELSFGQSLPILQLFEGILLGLGLFLNAPQARLPFLHYFVILFGGRAQLQDQFKQGGFL